MYTYVCKRPKFWRTSGSASRLIARFSLAVEDPSAVCTLTNLACVFKEKLCLGVELPHTHDLSGAGRPAEPSLRCVAHHHVTGRRVPGVSRHLFTQTHTERGEPRHQPEQTSIQLHMCREYHGVIAISGFIWEGGGCFQVPNSGKASNKDVFSVIDSSERFGYELPLSFTRRPFSLTWHIRMFPRVELN